MTAIVQSGDMPRERVELLKRTIAKGATDDELALFVQTCNRLRLDPFARQIFLVKRWDTTLRREVAQAQVSIDGFRLVAQRSAEYRGQMQAQWCGADGVWREVWLADEPPRAAKIGVHRAGFVEPLVRVATYASYAQYKKDGGPNRMWQTMPDVMLAKCAEALALRAAFPAELGGIYAPEEMGEDGAVIEAVPVAEAEPRALTATMAPAYLKDCVTLADVRAWEASEAGRKQLAASSRAREALASKLVDLGAGADAEPPAAGTREPEDGDDGFDNHD